MTDWTAKNWTSAATLWPTDDGFVKKYFNLWYVLLMIITVCFFFSRSCFEIPPLSTYFCFFPSSTLMNDCSRLLM